MGQSLSSNVSGDGSTGIELDPEAIVLCDNITLVHSKYVDGLSQSTRKMGLLGRWCGGWEGAIPIEDTSYGIAGEEEGIVAGLSRTSACCGGNQNRAVYFIGCCRPQYSAEECYYRTAEEALSKARYYRDCNIVDASLAAYAMYIKLCIYNKKNLYGNDTLINIDNSSFSINNVGAALSLTKQLRIDNLIQPIDEVMNTRNSRTALDAVSKENMHFEMQRQCQQDGLLQEQAKGLKICSNILHTEDESEALLRKKVIKEEIMCEYKLLQGNVDQDIEEDLYCRKQMAKGTVLDQVFHASMTTSQQTDSCPPSPSDNASHSQSARSDIVDSAIVSDESQVSLAPTSQRVTEELVHVDTTAIKKDMLDCCNQYFISSVSTVPKIMPISSYVAATPFVSENRCHMAIDMDNYDTDNNNKCLNNAEYVATICDEAAQLCFCSGRLSEAICWYELASQLDAKNTIYIYRKGVVLQSQGRRHAAAAAFTNALHQDPTCKPAMFNLAALHCYDHPDEALRLFSNLLDLDPNNTEVMSYIAQCHENQGRLTEALTYLTKAIQLDTGNYGVRRALQQIQSKLKTIKL